MSCWGSLLPDHVCLLCELWVQNHKSSLNSWEFAADVLIIYCLIGRCIEPLREHILKTSNKTLWVMSRLLCSQLMPFCSQDSWDAVGASSLIKESAPQTTQPATWKECITFLPVVFISTFTDLMYPSMLPAVSHEYYKELSDYLSANKLIPIWDLQDDKGYCFWSSDLFTQGSTGEKAGI